MEHIHRVQEYAKDFPVFLRIPSGGSLGGFEARDLFKDSEKDGGS